MRMIIIVGFLFSGQFLHAQAERSWIREGNKSYEKGQYKDAEILYRKGLEKQAQSPRATYNLGNSLYKQKNFQEASKYYGNVNMTEMDKLSRSKVYHNQGNSLMEDKKYQESIDAYKNALRNNPNDQDTRYNLAYAMSKLMQQQQQQQQKQQKKDDKDQKKDKQQQQQQQQQQNEQKQQQQKPQMSKQDAERMLEALKNNEKNTLDKLKKKEVKAVKPPIEKDW
ncbi:MAG: tetratricopeptide repeat protein [Bacteroidota bacterium]